MTQNASIVAKEGDLKGRAYRFFNNKQMKQLVTAKQQSVKAVLHETKMKP